MKFFKSTVDITRKEYWKRMIVILFSVLATFFIADFVVTHLLSSFDVFGVTLLVVSIFYILLTGMFFDTLSKRITFVGDSPRTVFFLALIPLSIIGVIFIKAGDIINYFISWVFIFIVSAVLFIPVYYGIKQGRNRN